MGKIWLWYSVIEAIWQHWDQLGHPETLQGTRPHVLRSSIHDLFTLTCLIGVDPPDHFLWKVWLPQYGLTCKSSDDQLQGSSPEPDVKKVGIFVVLEFGFDIVAI